MWRKGVANPCSRPGGGSLSWQASSCRKLRDAAWWPPCLASWDTGSVVLRDLRNRWVVWRGVETQFGGPKAMTSFDRMLLRMNPQLDFGRPNQPGGSKARWVESGEFAVSAVRIILALGPLGAYWIQPPAEGRDFHCDRHSSAGRCCAWYIEGVFSPPVLRRVLLLYLCTHSKSLRTTRPAARSCFLDHLLPNY